MAGKFEVYEMPSGKVRIRLKANNGQVIATGADSYDTKTDAKNACAAIEHAASSATIEEVES